MQSHDYRVWFESFAPPAPVKPARKTSLIGHANASACALCMALALTIGPAVGENSTNADGNNVCPVHSDTDPLRPCDDDTSFTPPVAEDPHPQEISDPDPEPEPPAPDEPEPVVGGDNATEPGPSEEVINPSPESGDDNNSDSPDTDSTTPPADDNAGDNSPSPPTTGGTEAGADAEEEPANDNGSEDADETAADDSPEKPGPSVDKPVKPPTEEPNADHTINPQSNTSVQTDGPTEYSAAFFSGKVEHRLPDVPPLTKERLEQLAAYADDGGDPYLVLAIHWDEKGFTSWEETIQTLPKDLMDDASREAYLKSQDMDAESALRLRSLAEALTLPGLRYGLGNEKIQKRLIQSTLDNPDIIIYEGGREDVRANHIDPRVLVSLRYLQLRYQQVEISSLHSGHSTYTSGGNISLHSLGQAVDIARLKDVRIQRSTQGEGSLVYQAVKDLAALPEGMGVAEVISLWNLGAPSFAMQDHDDHIHLGYR